MTYITVVITVMPHVIGSVPENARKGEFRMKKKRSELSTAQLEIMKIIWKRGETTISEVWQELQSRRKIARATVQTVIGRLEEKGWLKHREVGQAFKIGRASCRERV